MRSLLGAFLLALASKFPLTSLAAKRIGFPLHTEGRYIVDANGQRVKLACTNWYGAHLKTFAQNGLHARSPDSISAAIASLGFNCVRISYSVEAFAKNPVVRPEYISKLVNTKNQSFLDVFDAVVAALTAHGLMVIINNHNSHAGWCCDLTDNNGLWYNEAYPESDWIASLAGLASRYKSNPYVIGYDLRNEVRVDLKMRRTVVWGDTTAIHPLFQPALMDYRGAIVRAGTAVLEADPDALIIVEVLMGFWLCPFHLELFPLEEMKGHVVWSAHEYAWFTDGIGWAWEVCEQRIRYYHYSAVPRFLYKHLPFLSSPLFLVAVAGSCLWTLYLGRRCESWLRYIFAALCALLALVTAITAVLYTVNIPSRPVYDYASYAASRDAAWGHIANNNIGPMWVGEFGNNERSKEWNWTLSYLRERDFDFAYWSVDGEHFPSVASEFGDHIQGFGQDESYGLLNGDYQTFRHPWKIEDLRSLMSAKDLTSSPLGHPARRDAEVAEHKMSHVEI